MIQRCQYTRFTLESCNTFGIVAESVRKKLNGDTAPQFCVGGLIHIAHTARSNVTRDLVVCEFRADHGVNKNLAARFYQTPRMSLTHLTFEVKERGKRISVDV